MGGMSGLMGGGKGGDTSGGVSQEQAALAQYSQGQGELGAMSQFAGQGLGMGPSTNLTQAIGGTRFKQAEDLAKMSDADAKAQAAFNAQQSSALQQLVSSAIPGGGGGGGGGSGGGGGGFGA
jgi:hypothetical protein